MIENAIRVAGAAPSGANQQPWTFVVISDPELKREIRIAAEAEEKESYERRMSQEWLDALAPLGTDWPQSHISKRRPYVIVVFRQAYGLRSDSETGKESRVLHYYSEESVGIAVGFLLAAPHKSLDLATLTHTPSPMKFLSEILDRPCKRTRLRSDPRRLSGGRCRSARYQKEVARRDHDPAVNPHDRMHIRFSMPRL